MPFVTCLSYLERAKYLNIYLPHMLKNNNDPSKTIGHRLTCINFDFGLAPGLSASSGRVKTLV
jgi:hypothetical protein